MLLHNLDTTLKIEFVNMRSGYRYPSKKIVRELVDLVELGESFTLHEQQESERRRVQVCSGANEMSSGIHTSVGLIR